MTETFFSSKDIKTVADARAYLKRRAKDAVAAYKAGDHRFQNPLLKRFTHPIELAKYITRYY